MIAQSLNEQHHADAPPRSVTERTPEAAAGQEICNCDEHLAFRARDQFKVSVFNVAPVADVVPHEQRRALGSALIHRTRGRPGNPPAPAAVEPIQPRPQLGGLEPHVLDQGSLDAHGKVIPRGHPGADRIVVDDV